jgi:hypothetical protein
MKKFKLQHSAGVNFIPTPLIPEFNGNFNTVLIPVIAISWAYNQVGPINNLTLTIDPDKCNIPDPSGVYINIYVLHLSDSGILQEGPLKWSLPALTFSIPLTEPKTDQSHIILFAAYNGSDQIISAFKRFYVNKDKNNITYPYNTQLFKACYAKPFTFILVPPVCGFFGSFADLFGDFIALWEQGIIHN